MSTFRSGDLLRLIQQHGKTLTLIVKGSPTYDPSTGTVTGSDTPYTTLGYFYNYNLSEMSGLDIQMGDRRLVLPIRDTSSDLLPEPEAGDEVTGEGDKVTVVSVAKIMSGSSPVCYICQVRE